MYSDNPVADAMAEDVHRDSDMFRETERPSQTSERAEAAYYAGVTEDLFDVEKAIDIMEALRGALKAMDSLRAIKGGRKAA